MSDTHCMGAWDGEEHRWPQFVEWCFDGDDYDVFGQVAP